MPFVHKTTLNRKYVSRRDFHEPTVNIGNHLMHYMRFEGTRGVLDGEKAHRDRTLDTRLGSLEHLRVGFTDYKNNVHEYHRYRPRSTGRPYWDRPDQ